MRLTLFLRRRKHPLAARPAKKGSMDARKKEKKGEGKSSSSFGGKRRMSQCSGVLGNSACWEPGGRVGLSAWKREKVFLV